MVRFDNFKEVLGSISLEFGELVSISLEFGAVQHF
jgi:hypothetical protein